MAFVPTEFEIHIGVSENGEDLSLSWTRPENVTSDRYINQLMTLRNLVQYKFSQPRWRGSLDTWEFPPVIDNVGLLRKELPDAIIDDEAKLLVLTTEAIYAQAEKRAELIKTFMETKAAPHVNGHVFKRKPMSHQLVAWECARHAPFFGCLMDMGTGKTKVMSDVLDYQAQKRKNKKRPLRAVVVCPRSVLLNWARELALDVSCDYAVAIMGRVPRSYEEELEQINVVAHGGGTSSSVKAVLKLVRRKEVDLQIIITNYDQLAGRIDVLQSLKPDVCILDESHKIKSPNTKRSKLCVEFADSCDKRYILTGTPLTQSPFDLYTQFEYLGPKMGLLGYTNFHAYQHAIAQFGGYRGRKVKSWVGLGRVLESMAKWSFTVKKEQCLDLPDKTYEIRWVEMEPSQQEIYDQVCTQVLLELKALGAKVSIQNILVQYLRLAQVTSGFIKDSEGAEHTISESKIDQLMELLEDEGWPKVIVWSRFVHEINAICAALKKRGVKHVEYHGKIKDTDRQVAVDQFQNDPDTKVFVGTPATGGIGINLTAASLVVYVSNDFSLGNRMQSEDRSHRKGQKNAVTYVDLICGGSIDQLVYERLRSKRQMANFFSDPTELKNSLINFLEQAGTKLKKTAQTMAS